jgi:hypothetical protein
MSFPTAPLRRALPARWPWPLPALMAWLAGWGAWALLQAAGAPAAAAWTGGLLLASLCAAPIGGRRRRAIGLAGFPLSALAAGAGAGVPAWWWLLALVPLLALYPPRAWRDAPIFPTAPGALRGLAAAVGAAPTSVLDAGCGLGDGLRALAAEFPQARLKGVEWSGVLALLCRLRCRGARIERGDMWAPGRFAGHGLVYLFQRPESMARAWAKACAEMAPGSWLVSLEFEVPGITPAACLRDARRRPVWVYQLPAGNERSTAPATGR